MSPKKKKKILCSHSVEHFRDSHLFYSCETLMYAAEIDLKFDLSPLSSVVLFVVRGSLFALIFFLLKDSKRALPAFELVTHWIKTVHLKSLKLLLMPHKCSLYLLILNSDIDLYGSRCINIINFHTHVLNLIQLSFFLIFQQHLPLNHNFTV